MKCIICGDDLKLKAGDAPLWNVDNYGKPARAKTSCCGSMLKIFPVRSFNFVHHKDEKDLEDDWGYK